MTTVAILTHNAATIQIMTDGSSYTIFVSKGRNNSYTIRNRRTIEAAEKSGRYYAERL